ncbi:MAG: sugar phosphate isomerase/epimerase family protein [Planctomycetaceae bacterium]
MIPAISQVCSLASPFEDDLDGYADAAGSAIEIWLTKLEDYLATHAAHEVKSRAADRGLKFAAASFQGGLLVSQGEARRAAWEQFERRLDLCAELEVPTLVIIPDFLGPFGEVDIERAQMSCARAGELAQKRTVRLALEFQARGTFLNNLETAAEFVRSVGHPWLGLCLDLFHYYTGPSKFEDLARLSRENLFHVHACDLADRPRELATDANRILPGDGDFQLPPVFDRLRQIEYDRYVSLELLNPLFWQIPARQVGEIGLTALRVALGLARNGH